MTRGLGMLARLAAMFALGLTLSAASLAQTTSTTSADTRKFEVISVDGNQLVFRDERGTNEITVPDGFRFTVDGKQMAIGDLKPGMKGTAVVTTTTTVTPVTITEIKKGIVLSVGPNALMATAKAFLWIIACTVSLFAIGYSLLHGGMHKLVTSLQTSGKIEEAATKAIAIIGGTGGTCTNPVTFSGNSGNFNTSGAVCYRTNSTVNGWGCYNFDGRTVTVGGVARTCGQIPITKAADGYYYFAVTAGQFPWAGLYAW